MHTSGTISQIDHGNDELDCLIWIGKYRLLVIWNKSEVIKGFEAVKRCRVRQYVGTIVDKPACGIVVEVI